MEVLVIDQSRDDAARSRLATIRDARLRVLASETRGLARARNIGVRATRAPILLFTDDDCRVESTWAASVLAEFTRDPSLDAVYGRSLPEGDPGPDKRCSSIKISTEPRLVERLGWETVQDAIGHGNNMAFRRTCFERHGLFHEWLGAGTPLVGGEDTDFAFRILRAGARLYYSPVPVVHHDHWLATADFDRLVCQYLCSASAVFTRFVLRGSVSAMRVQASYFRGYRREIRWRRQIGDAAGLDFALRKRRAHVAGLFWGVVHARRSPPSAGTSADATESAAKRLVDA